MTSEWCEVDVGVDTQQKQDIGAVEDLLQTTNVDFESVQSGSPRATLMDEFEVNLGDDNCLDNDSLWVLRITPHKPG